MFSIIIKSMIDFFNEYTNGYSTYGIIRLVLDCLLVGICAFLIIRYFVLHIGFKAVVTTILVFLILTLIVILLDLWIFGKLLQWGVIIFIAILIIYYAPEIRNHFNGIVRTKAQKSFVTDEEAKENLISTLITTIDYLSRRFIGAIITIEKEHSLNAFIEKAVLLESNITYELLTTIFTPGTALHDGAVIIRGTSMMCAGAFLPPSDKADIPKTLGSRHRAAIGISEVSDAFTIVVSEETGHISTTIEGTITTDVSLESLRMSLKQNIIVK